MTDNDWVVVTGGTDGIGFAIADRFARGGCNVLVAKFWLTSIATNNTFPAHCTKSRISLRHTVMLTWFLLTLWWLMPRDLTYVTGSRSFRASITSWFRETFRY